MPVAVLGGSGFIGRAVCLELARKGMDPLSLDLRNGFDIRHPFDFADDIHGVIHLAGVLGTHELFDDVYGTIQSNIVGTVHVLDAIVRTGNRLPYVGITMPPVFPSVYTATKIAAAQFERVYRHEYKIPVVKVRAFNAFGPGQAHGPGHPQKIVPTFAVEAWAGRPLPIWGEGSQTVDLIGTTELARVLVEAFEIACSDDIAVEEDVVIDGGSGVGVDVETVANSVISIVHLDGGPLSEVLHLPMRRGEIPTTIFAKGEGWHLLSRPPMFDKGEFVLTVESYRNHQCV